MIFPKYVQSFAFLLGMLTPCSGAQDDGVLFRWEPLEDQAWEVLTQIFQYDRFRPHEGRVLLVEDHQTYYRREKLVFTGADGIRVPAWLAVPKIRQPPYPMVVLLHDLGGSKEDFFDDEAYWGFDLTRKLVASGFAVLALDARHHGERLAHNDYEALDVVAMKKGHFHAYRKTLVNGVIDVRRALDYVRARDDINMARVGTLGYGMGGIQAFMLAALERRIKVFATCAPPLFKQQNAIHALHNYASRVDDKPVLLLMGDTDEGYSYNEIKRLETMIPSRIKEKVFYDSGHQLPKSYTARAVRFFKANLGKWDEETPAVAPGQ